MSAQSTLISFSENESKLLNLKIGRCVSSNFNERQLLVQLLENQYDICRLTVASGDEEAVVKLEKTGLPYFYSGSITRYKTAVASLPERKFIHPDIEYEKYDGTQDDLLLTLLIGTWGTYPIGYYRTPFLNKLLTKEQEIIAVCEFYKKHNLQKNYPDNTIMFMKHRDNYVGFFALNIIGDRLESHIGGIIEPYRADGYFFDMQEYIRRFCVANKLNYFAFGARNENRRVNEIFQKFGYRAVDADNVFHIASLLSHSEKKEISSAVNITGKNSVLQYMEAIQAYIPLSKNIHANVSFRIHNLLNLNPGTYASEITFPVISDEESLMAVKLYNTAEKLLSVGYVQIM